MKTAGKLAILYFSSTRAAATRRYSQGHLYFRDTPFCISGDRCKSEGFLRRCARVEGVAPFARPHPFPRILSFRAALLCDASVSRLTMSPRFRSSKFIRFDAIQSLCVCVCVFASRRDQRRGDPFARAHGERATPRRVSRESKRTERSVPRSFSRLLALPSLARVNFTEAQKLRRER